ncbi:MAG: sigma-E processing peptidase SpoIIGA [Christensenellaceae bacterium]|nr:sigma-E processing peptidase SpoIIGA [Christensenellaceae bacterium]
MVFLNWFAIYYLICQVAEIIMKERYTTFQSLIAAFGRALIDTLFQYFSVYTVIIKLLSSLFAVVVLKWYSFQFKNLFVTFLAFMTIKLAFIGSQYMFGNALPSSIATCAGIIIVLSSIRYLFRYLYNFIYTKKLLLNVCLVFDYGEVSCTGYYDTGNRLYDDYNKPVVVIHNKLVEKLQLEHVGRIATKTVNGIKILPLVDLKIKVYYNESVHRVYEVRAAVSDYLKSQHDIILHRDMGEI